MAPFSILYPLSHALVYLATSLVVSGLIMLAGYAVYDLWPEDYWPKNRPTVYHHVPVIARRATLAEVDRITDFLIHEQEVVAKRSSNKQTTASMLLWDGFDTVTDSNVKICLAMRASASKQLQDKCYVQADSSECTSDSTWDVDVGVGEDAQVMAKNVKAKKGVKKHCAGTKK